jgi:hypothetical protein
MPMVLGNRSKNILKDVKGCHEGHDKASPNFCPNKKVIIGFFLNRW